MSSIKFTTKSTSIETTTGSKVYEARILDNQFEGINIVRIVFVIHDTKHEAQFKNWAEKKDYTLTFDQKEVAVNKKEEGFTLHSAWMASPASMEEKGPKPRVRVNESDSRMIIECEPDFSFTLKEEARDNDTPINFDEPDKPDKPNDNYNPQDDIDRAEQERQKKLTQEKAALNELIKKGQEQEDISQLTATLDEIEKKNATSAYQELKSEIESLRSKLNSKLTLDQEKAREIKWLNDLLTQNKLKNEDLPAETQTELSNLNNLSDLTQINNSKNKVSEAIHKKTADKTIQTLLNKINSLSSGASANEVAEIKKELEESLKTSNRFIKELWEKKSTEKINALNKLASLHKNQPGSPSKSGLTSGQKAAIAVGCGAAGVGLVVVIVAIVRSRRHRKIKEE